MLVYQRVSFMVLWHLWETSKTGSCGICRCFSKLKPNITKNWVLILWFLFFRWILRFQNTRRGRQKKTDSTMLGMIIRRSQVSQILKMFITAAGNSTYKKISKWIKLIFRGLFHFLSMFYPLLFWLVVYYLPPWKMMEFVSWDDYSQLNGKIKKIQTTNQYWSYTLQESNVAGTSCI